MTETPPVEQYDDVEIPLLPLLLSELQHRELTRDDFPDGKPLLVHEQLQLIEKALSLGRLRNAHLMAIAIGAPQRARGGRLEWMLRRWCQIRRSGA